MPGLGQGRGEIGETVASFPSYDGAQKAVSSLVAADIPARDIAIVGSGLRSVERVTGKLGYATAARQGAINGLLLGLFFSAIFVLGNSAVGVPVFVGVLFVGVALGMLLSIGGYAIIRRRRDFASVTQVIADHYEVTVLPTSIHRAREVLGPTTTVARPPAPPSTEPPQYGVRTNEPPRYGQRVDSGPEQRAPGQHVDEPPRYGQRITPAPHGAEAPPVDGGRPDASSPPHDGDDAQHDEAAAKPDDASAHPGPTGADDDTAPDPVEAPPSDDHDGDDAGTRHGDDDRA